MRLTKKSNKDSLGYEPIEELIKQNNASPIIAKLGQLEDIEDELGIELITLFKALKKGVYIKKAYLPFYPLALMREDYSNHTTKYFVFYKGKKKYLKLRDYGKTWALTREELEGDKK